MRIVFMGSPDFAIPTLDKLIDSKHDLAGVITAPDKPAGRGQKMRETAVKKFAKNHGLNILQPTNLKDESFQEELKSLNADIQVVVAFRMLPRSVWDMPPEGTINLHASLLPKYRGAAPIHWAIINGERETGVTTFQLKHEIDTGNILLQEKTSIGPDETTGDLYKRLKIMGAELVIDTVNGLDAGSIEPTPQPKAAERRAPKIEREDCRIHFDQFARDLHNFIRGMSPWPGAWTTLEGQQLKLFRSSLTKRSSDQKPGNLSVEHGALYLAATDYWIEIKELQLEGKKKMSASDFINGYEVGKETKCR